MCEGRKARSGQLRHPLYASNIERDQVHTLIHYCEDRFVLPGTSYLELLLNVIHRHRCTMCLATSGSVMNKRVVGLHIIDSGLPIMASTTCQVRLSTYDGRISWKHNTGDAARIATSSLQMELALIGKW